ncbi:MAG: non-ribosomal peptide synthetase, partial [bacterium]|nr:non-ribosomal peptide synthetase [bacterium]
MPRRCGGANQDGQGAVARGSRRRDRLRSAALPQPGDGGALAGAAGGVAGLQLPGSWQERMDPRVRLVNTYGPTEATIVATRWPLESDGDELGRVPIGRPVDGARAYVLDPRLEPVPAGVPGELALGGDGVARGYLGRPALTAERFAPDPFGPPGGRLYLTGDRVRWRHDERLEFLGRLDQQVKIRGFRIEIGEIEAVVAEHPRVQTAAVVAGRPAGGEAEPAALTAYVVTREAEAVADLRAWLVERLPEYMVPASFVVLDALPLTPAGKVDRAALGRLARMPESGRPGAAEGTYEPPGSEIEEILTKIFAELLGRERVGIYDNFFELGGHSLLAVQLATRVRDAFEIDLPL